MDYCDHKPHLNARLFQLLCSGIGLRQSARLLSLSPRCTELKFRKIARHLRRVNSNLPWASPEAAILQFDEFETYEGSRRTRPLTVPVIIEKETRFVVWAESAPIRPRGKMTARRREAILRDEVRFGVRRDGSRRCLLRVLQRAKQLVRHDARVTIETDEKPLYTTLVSRVFGRSRVFHRQTNSQVPRETWNPLFPINQTEAILRDLLGRLRRRSWLVSKKRRYLDLALHLHIAYRNYVRTRFNRDKKTPAQLLGVFPKRMGFGSLLSWRQDWGLRSIHPFARDQESIEAVIAEHNAVAA